jgi:uncharacterized membrane protein
MNLESSKILGGIGAILLLIGALLSGISYLSVLSLIGLILVMVGLYGLADYFGDRKIFTNALYGVITGIIGVIVAVAVAFVWILTNLMDLLYTVFPNWDGDGFGTKVS